MRKPLSPFAALALMTTLITLIGMLPSQMLAQDTPIEPVDSGLPQELVVNDLRYSIDIEVPIDANPMQPAQAADGTAVLAKPGGSDPLEAVYVPVDETNQRATRYLPQHVGNADAMCPADQVDPATLTGNDATWVAAGPEMDYTIDTLGQIGETSEGLPMYGIPGDDSLTNLFVANNQGQGPNSLVRYALLDAQNTPVQIANGFTFNGQPFVSQPGSVAALDGLVKVGCVGLFPMMAPTAEAPYTNVALAVNNAPAAFVAGEQPTDLVDESTPAPEPPVEEPATAVPPTEVPATAVPPTEVPATAVPPTEVPPTEVPPTEVPPTEVPPTEVPPTEVPPTEVPATEVPATEAPATEVPATEAPATEAPPTEVPPTAPPVQNVTGAEEGEVEPTAVPPTPDPAVPAPTPRPIRPTPTPVVYQAPASVATAPATVPSPAAIRAESRQCVGVIGTMDDNGVPDRLPRQVQYAGQSYAFDSKVTRDDAGELEAVSCIGPFVVLQGEGSDALYLGIQNSPDELFSFRATTAFTVQSQTYDTQSPNRLRMPDTDSGEGATYRAAAPLVPISYSSLSLVLYVADAEAESHDLVMGYAVADDVFGEYVPEGSAEAASQDVIDRAATFGVPSQFTLGSTRYVLVGLWTPFGSTTNGWLTLYGEADNAEPGRLMGLDPRRSDCLVFNRD